MLGARMWVLFVILVIVLLLVFPRKILPILGVTALLSAAAGGWHWWQHHQQQRLNQSVELTVSYAPEHCPAAAPLQVVMHNASARTVAELEWQFSARRAGYRGELTGGWTDVHSLDRPLAPGEQYRACYPAPSPNQHAVKRASDDLANLQLGIRNRRIMFAP